ncbi:hypothetical protein E1301_Tti019644 [Triplophysa tibetana]|uniref:Uncharacterized protein n=1 Tax=Triplophysa tibetana TaxID=1572043 RepID=A0A5A9PQK1_9TELE|nr:hypothetical protein E1301_Tti019644 [Triplophysa tibetana]
MGKYKKATKLVRSDLWAKAGGIDAVANELRENDVLNKNPGYSSEIWSQVSLALFGEDLKKNRCWLWMAWTKNHKGLRDRVHLGTKESNVMTSVVPENRTEGTESEDKETSSSMEVADVTTPNKKTIDAIDVESNTDSDASDLEQSTDSEKPKSRHDVMMAQEKESGLDIWRQCPKVRKTFCINMERKRWNKIKPHKGSSKLRQHWTNYMYDSFKEKNPCCILSFRYQHVKSPQSRKVNLPYLRVSAACTIPSCTAKYSFKLQEKPAKLDKTLKISVHQTGDIQHKLSEKKFRPATRLKRGKIAKALTNGPSDYFYTKLQTTPKEQLLAGNMSECLNKNVLSVIRHEMRKKEYIHPDILKEISLMQTILQECDTKYFSLPGYIQNFTVNPFMVHMYSELGISILVHHLRSRLPVSLYLDATGGVVSKIPDQTKCVLYYALILSGKGPHTPPLPVCEMLSNDHSIPPITFWLMQFALHLTKYTHLTINKVETDYSWALIQSVMLAFNKEHIISYLNRAYECCTGKKPWDDSKTVLHICATHVLKAVRNSIRKQTDDEGLRNFALFVFARLQNAISMTEASTVFRAFCTLLTTPQNTERVKESRNLLESIIMKFKQDTPEEIFQSEDWETWIGEQRNHEKSISGNSPFFAYFQQILKEVTEHSTDEMCSTDEDNPYFCPGILQLLFNTYLAIFPLWSGLLLGDLRRHESQEQDSLAANSSQPTRDSNCHIENWFRIVKHSILHSKKKLRPGTFIRKMHRSMQGRYTEHIIQHNLSQELLLKPLAPMNLLDQSKETWMRKDQERRPVTKSKFFSAPESVPVPQKERICKDVTKRKKRS